MKCLLRTYYGIVHCTKIKTVPVLKEFISPVASLYEACREVRKWKAMEQYAVGGKD